MSHPSKIRLPLPLLALGLALALAASVPAVSSAYTSFSISIGNTPHFRPIPGTSVMFVNDTGVDYDMFSYGGSYWVYRDNLWYSSPRPRGRFRVVEERYVPRAFYSIPRERWHHYPSAWARNDVGRGPGRNGRGHAYSHDQNDNGHRW